MRRWYSGRLPGSERRSSRPRPDHVVPAAQRWSAGQMPMLSWFGRQRLSGLLSPSYRPARSQRRRAVSWTTAFKVRRPFATGSIHLFRDGEPRIDPTDSTSTVRRICTTKRRLAKASVAAIQFHIASTPPIRRRRCRRSRAAARTSPVRGDATPSRERQDQNSDDLCRNATGAPCDIARLPGEARRRWKRPVAARPPFSRESRVRMKGDVLGEMVAMTESASSTWPLRKTQEHGWWLIRISQHGVTS
jgi:hypothetical protein